MPLCFEISTPLTAWGWQLRSSSDAIRSSLCSWIHPTYGLGRLLYTPPALFPITMRLRVDAFRFLP